jgi:hypothetical protein
MARIVIESIIILVVPRVPYARLAREGVKWLISGGVNGLRNLTGFLHLPLAFRFLSLLFLAPPESNNFPGDGQHLISGFGVRTPSNRKGLWYRSRSYDTKL